MDTSKTKAVYMVTHRANPAMGTSLLGEPFTNKFLTRIGTAYVEEDGSYRVQLEAFPIAGELLICDPKSVRSPENG